MEIAVLLSGIKRFPADSHNLEVAGSNPVPAIFLKSKPKRNLRYLSKFDSLAQKFVENGSLSFSGLWKLAPCRTFAPNGRTPAFCVNFSYCRCQFVYTRREYDQPTIWLCNLRFCYCNCRLQIRYLSSGVQEKQQRCAYSQSDSCKMKQQAHIHI